MNNVLNAIIATTTSETAANAASWNRAGSGAAAASKPAADGHAQCPAPLLPYSASAIEITSAASQKNGITTVICEILPPPSGPPLPNQPTTHVILVMLLMSITPSLSYESTS